MGLMLFRIIIVSMSVGYYHFLQESDNSTAEASQIIPGYQVSHINMMPYLWTVVIDFSIFFAIYKFKALSVYVHALIGLFVGLTTLITSLPILIDEGIPAEEDESYEQRHFIIGLIVIIFLFLQMLLGLLTKTLQLISWSHPYLIYFINVAHKYIGYSLIILCKIQVFLILNLNDELTPTFWGLIGAQTVLGSLWVICKALSFKLEATIVPKYDQQLKVVQSLSALQKQDQLNLGVFANYIYNLDPLLKHHPNGYRIIQSTKGIDLDRFLYGMYPAERFPLLPANSHSWKSLSLLDDPIAKLQIPAVYSGLQADTTDVELANIQLVSDKCFIYQLQLKKVNGRFEFKGYTSLRQIGRYYSLTADGTTRLYTSTAFLDPRNLEFIANELGRANLVEVRAKSNNQMRKIPDSERKLSESNYISLLIKRYPKGQLTPKLVNKAFTRLQLSEPRGEGLHLQELTPGKVIIVAGGTGLYPFSDLIDLLFKDLIASSDKSKQLMIYMHNPLLESKPFQHFSFHLMLAVHQIEDIHPITLMQLLELVQHSKKFKLTLRLAVEPQEFRGSHPELAYTSERFDKLLIKEMNSEPFRKVWVCGPPAMTTAIIAEFDQNKVSHDHYLMV